jgi:hypothetical protein
MCYSGLCPHEGWSGERNLTEEDMIKYHEELEDEEPEPLPEHIELQAHIGE